MVRSNNLLSHDIRLEARLVLHRLLTKVNINKVHDGPMVVLQVSSPKIISNTSS